MSEATPGRPLPPKARRSRPERPTFGHLRRSLSIEFAGQGSRIAGGGVLLGLPVAVEVVVVFLIASVGTGVLGNRATKLPFGITASTTTLAAFAVGAIVLRGALDVGGTLVRARLVRNYEHASRAGLLKDFTTAEWEVQSQLNPATVLSTVGANLNRARDAYGRLIDTVGGAIGFLVMLAGSFVAGGFWVLGIVVSTGLLALLFRTLIRESHSAGEASRAANLQFSHAFLEVFALAREIRLFRATRHTEELIDRASFDLAESNARGQIAGGLLGSLTGTAVYLVAGVGLLIISTLHVEDPRPYVVVVLLLYRGIGYGRSFQSAYQDLMNGLPAVADIQQRRNQFAAARVPTTGTPFEPPLERVTFDDVGLTYPDGTVALRNASFEIERGAALGLVGPSGSGKSTVVQLLLRLRLPTSGRVLLNGIDIRDIEPQSWFGHAVLVPQDAQTFNATILDNVVCFRRDISRDDAIEALRQAQLLDEVLALPDGLETVVGAGGRRLSGGQSQRLCIARALASSPDVLVLDEPTSALDLLSEEVIRATLQGLRGRITVIVIAHRLSTLRICDRVMVLKDGHIEGVGTRQDLETTSAFYAEAVRLAKLT